MRGEVSVSRDCNQHFDIFKHFMAFWNTSRVSQYGLATDFCDISRKIRFYAKFHDNLRISRIVADIDEFCGKQQILRYRANRTKDMFFFVLQVMTSFFYLILIVEDMIHFSDVLTGLVDKNLNY